MLNGLSADASYERRTIMDKIKELLAGLNLGNLDGEGIFGFLVKAFIANVLLQIIC